MSNIKSTEKLNESIDDDLPEGVRFDKKYLKYVARDNKAKKRRDFYCNDF